MNRIVLVLFIALFGLMFWGNQSFRRMPIGNPTWTPVTRAADAVAFATSKESTTTLYYTFRLNCTATIGSNSSATVLLQYSKNNGATWINGPTIGNSNQVTLAVVLNSQDQSTQTLTFEVPSGALVKLTKTLTGTATVDWISGIEKTD